MIKLTNVHLRYPVMGLKSHSLQMELSTKVGGIFGSTKDSTTEFVHALNDISLTIDNGERLGILGHNGAGKTTLLRVLAGVYPPTSGTAEIDGKISAMTDFSLGMDPNVSGYKNIIFRLVFMGYSYEDASNACEEIIEFSELGEFIHMPTRTYSTGMFLRLAFAISTHFTPDILILDEVIGAGDESFREKALARLDSLFKDARIVVLSSHDLAAIEKYCSKVIVMKHGEVIYSGEPTQAIEFYKQSVLS